LTEFDVIRRLQRQFPAIGDDAAMLDGGLLAAADVVVQGVDFTPATPLEDVGWRAVAVNVSDIAAMGGTPTALLVSVVGPPATDVDRLYLGIADACEVYGCTVVGGDLSNGPELVVAVTVLGRADRPVLRSGARAGDGLFVSGALGAAAAAGYGVRPAPPVALGGQLSALGATAMIDISDGLAADLGHLLDASGCGAQITFVPIAAGATEEQAWSGGEDYELLFTLPAGVVPPKGCVQIGEILSDPSVRPPERGGWQHRFP
jgi:thiamine-monophosphate kinase